MAKWSVGQEVIVRAGGTNKPEVWSVVLTKVGRRWATFGTGWQERRFDVNTGICDMARGGYYFHAFSSADEMAAFVAAEASKRQAETAWREFRRRLDRHYNPPDGLTAESIAQAEAILFPPTSPAQEGA